MIKNNSVFVILFLVLMFAIESSFDGPVKPEPDVQDAKRAGYCIDRVNWERTRGQYGTPPGNPKLEESCYDFMAKQLSPYNF